MVVVVSRLLLRIQTEDVRTYDSIDYERLADYRRLSPPPRVSLCLPVL